MIVKCLHENHSNPFFFTMNLASKADHLRLFHLLNWDFCTIRKLKPFWGSRVGCVSTKLVGMLPGRRNSR